MRTNKTAKLLSSERGASLMESALLLALIVLFAAGAIKYFGKTAFNPFACAYLRLDSSISPVSWAKWDGIKSQCVGKLEMDSDLTIFF